MQPRVLRPTQAAEYLGMGRTLFERLIKPNLTAYKLGEVGIGYDRLELDEAWDQYKQFNQAQPCPPKEPPTWQQKSTVLHGTKKPAKAGLKKTSEENAFAAALKQARKPKPNKSTTAP